jgi:hypothetical protein
MQRSGFDSRRDHIFWQIVGLERGPLSFVSTIEELLGRERSGSGLENREYGRRDPLHWLRDTPYPQNLALTSLTNGGRSVAIIRFRTEATEFVCCLICIYILCFVTVNISLNLSHFPSHPPNGTLQPWIWKVKAPASHLDRPSPTISLQDTVPPLQGAGISLASDPLMYSLHVPYLL